MLKQLLETIRRETQPIAGHTDPKAIDDCWRSVFEELEAIEQRLQSDRAYRLPDSIQEALNSGDGVYRP